MNKCQFCNKETDMPWFYWCMTPIIPEMEEKINELGRNGWYNKINWDNPTQEQLQLSVYDQLLNTIGKGYLCKECIDKDNELYNKYYSEEKKDK